MFCGLRLLHLTYLCVCIASAAQFHWAGQNPGVSYLMPDFMIVKSICAQKVILNHGTMLLQDDG